jgi:hypothetical protein
MGTHAAIGIINDDNTVTGIYVHYDGYISHTGNILKKYYNRETTYKLMELGDLSLLEKEIGEKHDYHDPYYNWCISYKRDRGETDTDAEIYDNIEDFINNFDAKYIYLLDNDNIWKVYKNGTWEEY